MQNKLSDELRKKYSEEGLHTCDLSSIKDLASETRYGTDVQVSEILIEYQIESEIRAYCYVCGRRNHRRGFVALLSNCDKILLGNCCAEFVANPEMLNRATRRFEAKKNAVHYSVAAREKIMLIPQLIEEIELIHHYCDQLDEIRTEINSLLGNRKRDVLRNSRANDGRLVIERRMRNIAKESLKSTDNTDERETYSTEKVFDKPVFGLKFIQRSKNIEILRYEIFLQLRSLNLRSEYSTKKRKVGNIEFLKIFNEKVRDAFFELSEHFSDANSFFADKNLHTIDEFIRREYLTETEGFANKSKQGTFLKNSMKIKQKFPKPLTLPTFKKEILKKAS